MTDKQQTFLINYTVDRLTEWLVEDYEMSIATAMQFLYNSDTYQKLINPETGLYAQSPSYVFELLDQEYKTGSNV